MYDNSLTHRRRSINSNYYFYDSHIFSPISLLNLWSVFQLLTRYFYLSYFPILFSQKLKALLSTYFHRDPGNTFRMYLHLYRNVTSRASLCLMYDVWVMKYWLLSFCCSHFKKKNSKSLKACYSLHEFSNLYLDFKTLQILTLSKLFQLYFLPFLLPDPLCYLKLYLYICLEKTFFSLSICPSWGICL